MFIATLASASLPTVSPFYGIVIAMYYNDHDPPHFHARYAEYHARVAETGDLLDGDLPVRAVRLVKEWAALHRDELDGDWRLAQPMLPLRPIEPLS